MIELLAARKPMDAATFFMVFGPIAAILGFVFLARWRIDRERRRRLAEWAAARGVTMREESTPAPSLPWPHFDEGRGRKIDCLIECGADARGPRRRFFRFRFYTGGGKNRRTHRSVCVVLERPEAPGPRAIPNGQIRPRRWSDGLGRLFGGGGMDYDDDPAFKDAFRIDARDPAAIRVFLDMTLRRQLLDAVGERTVGFDDRLTMVAIKGPGSVETFEEAEQAAFRIDAVLRARAGR